MHKFYRSVLLTGMVAVGLAGCGDDVTVVEPPPPPPPPAPTVKSISVAPNPGSVPVGGTITMSAAVVADAGVATTVTWTSSDAAKATVNAASGVVTGVAAGSVAITATSTVNPAVQGNATVNVTAAPTATVTGVTVTPGTAGLVVGQTVQLSASVQGANNPAQTVTWSSLSAGIASVSAGGLVTGVSNGTAVIRGCSTATGFTNVCGSMSVTVVTPSPASVSIQSLTTGVLGTPVVLTNVNGQIEATVNIESGDQQLDRVEVRFGGKVIASQSFGTTAAPAEEGAAGAPVTVVLSFNTNQLRKVNNLFVPVIFNGPTEVTAWLYVQGSSTPKASNAIPVVVQNRDLMIGSSALAANATAGPIVVGGNSWYKGNVNVSGGNYVSFFPVTPTSITLASNLCGNTANLIGSQTPEAGIALNGTFTCGNTVEAGVNLTGAYAVTAGTPPAGDVVYLAAAGYTAVGTAFVLAGENRYNPLTGVAPALTAIMIDNQAPTVSWATIGFLSATCAGTTPNPGCWIKNSYDIAARLTATDGGSGSGVLGNTKTIRNYAGGATCSGSNLATSTGADFAETTVVESYRVCGIATDPLGNSTSTTIGAGMAQASNAFSVDNTPPILAYVGGYAVATVNPPEVNVLPLNTSAADTISFSLTDGNSGVDANLSLSVSFIRTLNDGGSVSTTACSNPVNTLTGSGTTPQFMLTPVLISSCTLPGERTWTAVGTDRAGNMTASISRQLEYNPAPPMIAAVNIVPTYAAAANVEIDVLATDDEDLRSAEITLSTTTNLNNDIRVVFGPSAGFFTGIWGANWDGSLFLATTLFTNSRLTLSASYSLAGYAENVNPFVAGQTPIDTITTRVFDTFGAASAPFVTPLNAAFVNAASYATTTNPWAAGLGNVLGASFETVGASCRFEYSTPTNNPEVFTRVWLVNDDGANTYTVLADINSQPALISDNGIQRLYRYTISTTQACAAVSGLAGGANNMFAIKSNVAAIIF